MCACFLLACESCGQDAAPATDVTSPASGRAEPQAPAPPTADTRRPLKNLLLISLDTQRADRLALFGGPVQTPNLARIAARGVVFERAYAHIPITAPSHASLFTSQLPSEHGLHNNAQRRAAPGPTLATQLRAAGRQTAAFVSLAALARETGLDAGFQTYVDETPNLWWLSAPEVNGRALPFLREKAEAPFFLFLHYSDAHGPYLPPERYQQVVVTKGAQEIDRLTIDGRRVWFRTTVEPGDNTFVFTLKGPHRVRGYKWRVTDGFAMRFGKGFDRKRERRKPGRSEHTLAPDLPSTVTIHNPHPKPASVSVRFDSLPLQPAVAKRTGYDAETRFLDAQLGAVLDVLDARQLWDETAVVVTADHGEELGEHGFFGHVHNLRDSVLHVPLVIVAPGFFAPGSRVPAVVRHIDVLPTLAKLMDFEPPPDMRGEALWPAASVTSRPVVVQTFEPQARNDGLGVIVGNHKLVRYGKQAPRFYELDRDPTEHRGLGQRAVRERQALRSPYAELRGLLDAAAAQRRGAAPVQLELSEQQVDALRALGYMDE